MAFHGILVVRDEADFIAESLAHLASWCDTVYVFDTGSTDGTWDIVQQTARREKSIIPLRSEPVWYQDGLRAFLFHELRARFRKGDWILRLDADEVYHIPPPEFVRALAPLETRIHCQMYEFVLRRCDLGSPPGSAIAPPASVIDARRHYYADPHPELRMFRYRPGMVWLARSYEPYDPGILARERLPIRHYRGRSEAQLKKRCFLRSEMARVRRLSFEHWKVQDWRYWVWADADPRLRCWAPGTDLPLVRDSSHLPPALRRARELAFYHAGLHHLRDRLRTRWRGYTPIRIAPAEQNRLADGTAVIGGSPEAPP